MVTGPSFIAASSLIALAFAAPVIRNDAKAARSLVERAAYQVFSGDGTTEQGWPDETSWLDFESAWTANLPVISASCAQFNVPENSKDEIASIKKGLAAASKESGVSQSYLLAIMMQESKGCVRAPTTNYGVRNPGLFQDFNGEASCNDGTVINPCPDETIAKMIAEGAGIGMTVGLSIGIADSGASDVSKYYKAARIYNSGSIDASGNLGKGIATHCYASDIANRLIGWTTDSTGCDENIIGTLSGGPPSTPTTPSPVASSAPSTPSTPVASSAPSTPSTPVESSTPSATVAPAIPEGSDPIDSTPSAPATPVDTPSTSSQYPGAVKNCKSWYEVKSGDDCRSTGVDMATLTKLNAGLDSTCSNLWLGSSYCIGA